MDHRREHRDAGAGQRLLLELELTAAGRQRAIRQVDDAPGAGPTVPLGAVEHAGELLVVADRELERDRVAQGRADGVEPRPATWTAVRSAVARFSWARNPNGFWAALKP